MSKVNAKDSSGGFGSDMYDFVSDLFPVCRSITGDGLRHTLRKIREHLPGLQIHEVPTGTQAFDWAVPDEWNIRSAHLIGPEGKDVIDFAKCNLHVVGYSEPVDKVMTLDELQHFLHSRPDMPNAIPYVTSYYKRNWGICLEHRVREALKPGKYRIVIDSDLGAGSLSYGELLLPGEEKTEVLLSTYVCHPSMANNELSGPVVATWLAKWLLEQPRRYTYRIVFIPETIGSIVYLSRNLEQMKANTIAGFNISCVGDDRGYSYLSSRNGNTLSDRIARAVLSRIDPDFKQYSFLDRGSDERQYCAPGIDLPVCSVMRTKYDEYPEYHTSLDNLEVVSAEGLAGGFVALKQCLEIVEQNDIWRASVLCEPQLGKRGLYPTTSTNTSGLEARAMMNVLAYADGLNDVLDISEVTGVDILQCLEIIEILRGQGLLIK